MIELNNIEKKFSSDFTLKIDELKINDAERVAIIGPNGSGKSTLLRILSGIIAPDKGEVKTGFTKANIGYQPQTPFCFSGSVESNVKLGAHSHKDIDLKLSKCDLTQLKQKKSFALSGGERQRMCFCRMIAHEYKLLLLDEPFSAADIETAEKLQNVLVDYCEENGTTLLMSTHLPSQALAVSTKVLILNNGCVAEFSQTSNAINCPSSDFGQKFIKQWRLD